MFSAGCPVRNQVQTATGVLQCTFEVLGMMFGLALVVEDDRMTLCFL